MEENIIGCCVCVGRDLFHTSLDRGWYTEMGGLTPEKLTPLVVEKTNEFIEAHLECERVELTYFETYPYLGVKLTNGRLISHLAEDSIGYQGI